MFARSGLNARIDWTGSCRRRALATVLALTLACLFAIAGRTSGAEAQTLSPSMQSTVPDDVSAARRWGGRRAFGREGRRRWFAHRGGRHGARRDRDVRRPGKAGDRRPGNHRPDGPGRPPAGDSKPDPHDHVNKPDGSRGEPDRNGPHFGRSTGTRLSLVPPAPGGFGPQGPAPWPPGGVPPGGAPPGGVPQPPGPGGLDTFVPDEVLVTVARTAPERLDDAVGQSHGLQLMDRTTLELVGRRVVRYRIADGRPVAALLAALRTDTRIFEPQPNYYYRTRQDGAPPSRSGGLQYALAKLEAVRAQALARGRGALVAVIDTGADATHPDLAGAIVESFDAVGTTRGVDPHGTAVAGIIAANGVLRGVAPDANLLNVRAFAPGADGGFAATTLNLLRGIEWAMGRRARVLNMSFAGPRDALLERGITAAGDRGAIIVAAAGNGGANAPPAYPAAYAPVIAVTAIDHADRRYHLANQGRYISLAAPGVDILTASAGHAHRIQSGTSFAAAHVSGIIALMIERDAGLTADGARRALVATADDLGPPGPDDQYGAGRANAFAAVRALGRH